MSNDKKKKILSFNNGTKNDEWGNLKSEILNNNIAKERIFYILHEVN